MRSKDETVHYRIFGACISFIPACTLDWCYNSDLFGAERTENEKNVTCKKCLEWLHDLKGLISLVTIRTIGAGRNE